MDNATTFGAQAGTYASARPSYPEDLFDWIKSQSPQTKCVWDVGTGSGQAARSLAERFEQVLATDIDSAQIEQAPQHPKIKYSVAPAHQSGLKANSVDAITVATALHWFDHRLFWQEVRRAARPGALFCGWTYHRAVADDDVQKHLLEPVTEILKPYWSDGNRLSWRGYFADELEMPFDVIETPKFACALSWTPLQIAAFISSWSAHKKARVDGHEDTLKDIEKRALSKLGKTPRPFTLPLNILAARVN